MSNLSQNNAELLKFDGKPSWGAALPQAMQHVLAMLIGNITPPMLIAGTCGLSAEEKIMLTQAAMIIGGITTLLQLFPVFGFGMKLPNVMGVAFAYMPILTIIGQQYGIAAIFGSQLVAGFVSIFVGMFIGKIRKFFPPIVSGTVVMSIGLSLYKTAISYIGGGSAAQADGTFGSGKFWLLAILTLIVTLACNFFGKGLVKASGMLIGIVVGYAAALAMGGVVSFADFEAASWFALPRPFYFGLEFHFDAIIMMILMYMVQAVQTIGDVSSTAIGGFGRQSTDQELGGAIKGQGVCGMLGALIGGLPTDPYSQNVGLICTTKVVARRVFTMVGVIMLLAGIIGGLAYNEADFIVSVDGIDFPVVVKQDRKIVYVAFHVDMLPGACRIFGDEHLHAVAVDVGEDVELAVMITDAGCPNALAVGFFSVLQTELVAHVQTVEAIAEELPVHQILGMQHHQSGHGVHGGSRQIEIFSHPDHVGV